jgi:hypothetical protein
MPACDGVGEVVMPEPIYETMSAEQLEALMQEFGFSAIVETATDGAKFIVSRANGVKFVVFLYRGANETDFTSAQFFMGIRGSSWALNRTNGWNREKRFLKAYNDSDGDVCVDYDFMLSGVTKTYLRTCFAVWEAQLEKFLHA